jgi:hypothetical protein
MMMLTSMVVMHLLVVGIIECTSFIINIVMMVTVMDVLFMVLWQFIEII